MKTRIFLNEWTEIEVAESKAEVKKRIREKVAAEKLPYKWDDLHFIEVTIEKIYFTTWDQSTNFEKSNSMDLYFKRILFIYEI